LAIVACSFVLRIFSTVALLTEAMPFQEASVSDACPMAIADIVCVALLDVALIDPWAQILALRSRVSVEASTSIILLLQYSPEITKVLRSIVGCDVHRTLCAIQEVEVSICINVCN
jgi:hypothetical protein